MENVAPTIRMPVRRRAKNTCKSLIPKNTTLDIEHGKMLDYFISDQQNINILKSELIKLKNQYSGLPTPKTVDEKASYQDINIEICRISDKINRLEEMQGCNEYLFITFDTLRKYYVKDNINNKEDNIPNRGIGLHSIIKKIDDTPKLQNASILYEYLSLVYPIQYGDYNYNKQLIEICPYCKGEKTILYDEGVAVCPTCGITNTINIDGSRYQFSGDTIIPESTIFPYKKIGHFEDLLNDFQGKGTRSISDEVFSDILEYMEHEGIKKETLTRPKLRTMLKILGHSNQYCNISFIFFYITGQKPPQLTPQFENMMRMFFKEIKPVYEMFCPSDRINFANYPYIIEKDSNILENMNMQK